jgi:hypothetical protein
MMAILCNVGNGSLAAHLARPSMSAQRASSDMRRAIRKP